MCKMPETATRQRGLQVFLKYFNLFGIYAVFAGLIVLFSCMSKEFLSGGNIVNILQQSVTLGTAAVGMTFVMIMAGIDISVGSTMCLSVCAGGACARLGQRNSRRAGGRTHRDDDRERAEYRQRSPLYLSGCQGNHLLRRHGEQCQKQRRASLSKGEAYMKRIYGHNYKLVEECGALPEKNPVTALWLNEKYSGYARKFQRPEDTAQWQSWKDGLRGALAKVLRLDRLGAAPTPTFTVLSEERTAKYQRKKITYETAPGSWVSAYLLVPHGLKGPTSAALALHGHFHSAKDSVVFPEKAAGVAYAHALAEQGILVLAPDNAGMADTANVGTGERDVAPDYVQAHVMGGCDLLWRRFNHMGIDITGFRLWELQAGLNMLCAMEEVDATRIGCAGLSGGCWLSQLLTALDERISAVVLSGYFTTFAQTLWHEHCVCHHPFGIGELCDMPDISALIAPRPQFVESGSLDTPYPPEPAYAMTCEAYRLLGVPDNIDIHIYEGGHRFEGTRSIPWLIDKLVK